MTPSRFLLSAAVMVAALGGERFAVAQLSNDEQATMLLQGARNAFNEGEFTFAATKFAEFVQKYGGHPEVNSAKFGWGVALLQAAPRDEAKAAEVLAQVAGVGDFAERPRAQYYLALTARSLGQKALAEAAAKPNEPQHRDQARQHFGRAAQQLTDAIKLLEEKLTTPTADGGKTPSEEMEWVLRARCDLAEAQLQTNQIKEALATSEPFVADPLVSASRWSRLGRYYHGYAAYLLKDYPVAAVALSKLAPFGDPAFGVHARYLLARVKHLTNEPEEAAKHYHELLGAFDKEVAAAKEAVQNPAALKNDPAELARLDALSKAPPPDHVARAGFFLGVLLGEQGKFAEARDRFAAFDKAYPNSPLSAEAKLRLGTMFVNSKQFAEALSTLPPLQDHPQLGDQVRWWIGRAQVGAADSNNGDARKQQLAAAAGTLKQAADRAGQLAGQMPECKLRRSDILLETADVYQQNGQLNEAVDTFRTVLNEQPTPQRAEEATQRLATALHLAGKWGESEQLCRQFLQQYPQSPLAAAVLFRSAENAFAEGEEWFKKPANEANREVEANKRYEEAEKRYTELFAAAPEFPQLAAAKYGLGVCKYRRGQFADAAKLFAEIAPADRGGPLAPTSFLAADCALRLAPESASDAPSAKRLLAESQTAAQLLETFVAANAMHPLVPEALVKLGQAYARAASAANEPEKAPLWQNARQTLEKVLNQFPQSSSRPVAAYERALVMIQQSDVGGAINELNQFQNDPWKASAVAPLALLRLSALHRAQNKPEEAVKILAVCRQQHEGALVSDPTRPGWAALIQYHHALATLETNKPAEARALFEATAKQFPDRVEAVDAAWRAGQCRRVEAQAKLSEARKKLATPNLSPQDAAAANAVVQEGVKQLVDAAQYLDQQVGPLEKMHGTKPSYLQLLYEAAWTQRALADEEIEVARKKSQVETHQKLQQQAQQNTPPGLPVPIIALPDTPLTDVLPQPAEKRARLLYHALINAGDLTPISQLAQFEFAEYCAIRGDVDAAAVELEKLIGIGVEPELQERARLRLGVCQLLRKEYAKAAAAIEPLTESKQPLVAVEARHRAAEFLLAAGKPEAAVTLLLPLRDAEAFKNLPGHSDRGLLRLGQAYGDLKQWDAARQTFEQLPQRFPQSVWVQEARYGVAWTFQGQGNFDQAVNTYRQVTQATAAEIAAKAQLQIGLCRFAQKKYPEAISELLVVPFTYDYSDVNAQALFESAKAFGELKQPEQSARLLKRVIADYERTAWAEQAKALLGDGR